MTRRWPEEERSRGEAEYPDLLDRISFDGSRVGFDGSRVGLDGYGVSSVGSRVGLDGSRGTQTDPDGRLEVIWRMFLGDGLGACHEQFREDY